MKPPGHVPMTVPMRRLTLACLAATLLVAAPASAFRLGHELTPVAHSPANAFATDTIDDEVYDGATHCSRTTRPGVVRFTKWVARHSRGISWGTYRCEKWGPHEASLHAENRALDWHLDVSKAADRHDARKLIEMLLAPDKAGNEHALARRMGVEEIIWDCSYWGAGMEDFGKYQDCYSRRGELKQHVNRTVGHRDHIHFGFSKRGAAARTSFWTTTRR
jgi:hypothetical protein